MRQLGGSLEAVLGQQQRFLLAAAAWAAREAVQRREAQAHSAAAAAELLHARNVLAEALGREQGLRDKCEVLLLGRVHVVSIINERCGSGCG